MASGVSSHLRRWGVLTALVGAGCNAGGHAEMDAGTEEASASTTEDPPDLPQSEFPAEFSLGNSFQDWSALEPGAPLEFVRGNQGLLMFALGVRTEHVDPGGTGSEPRIDIQVRIPSLEDDDTPYAQQLDFPLNLLDGPTTGILEHAQIAIIPEDQSTLDPSELNGELAVVSATLRGAHTEGHDIALMTEVPVVVEYLEEGTEDGEASETTGVDAGDGPVFVDVAAEVGLDIAITEFVQPPDCTFQNVCFPDWQTGGAAVADFDLDGDPDIFFPRHRLPNLLMVNDGSGHFTDRAVEYGVDLPMNANGAAWADIDHDGDPDLMIATLGDVHNWLFINDGESFDELSYERGIDVDNGELHAGTTVTFGDYDLDGYPDVAFSEWRWKIELAPGQHHARVLHNRGTNGAGYYDDATASLGLDFEIPMSWDTGGSNGPALFAPVFADVDGDRVIDLLVAADFDTSQVYWGVDGTVFTDGTASSGVPQEEIIYGMGTAVADLDGDGLLDWWISDITRSPPSPYSTGRMFLNRGNRDFDLVSLDVGLIPQDYQWGAEFLDYDNDGDLDFAVTGGQIMQASTLVDQSAFYRQLDDELAFEEVGASVGIDDDGFGRGLYPLDFDMDGDLDILVVQLGEPPLLYRNDGGNENHWLRVIARGTVSATDGFGARIWVTPTEGDTPRLHEIGTEAGFLGHGERVAHFGLGPDLTVVHELRIDWLASGFEQVFHDVAADQTLTVWEAP